MLGPGKANIFPVNSGEARTSGVDGAIAIKMAADAVIGVDRRL